MKNKNIIFKIRRSKVTDYAALRVNYFSFSIFKQSLIILKEWLLHILVCNTFKVLYMRRSETIINYLYCIVIKITLFLTPDVCGIHM